MKILALDQATHITGWAFSIDGKLILHGRLKAPSKKYSEDWMVDQIVTLMQDRKPDHLALEGVQLQDNPKTLITLAEFRGRIKERARLLHIAVLTVSAPDLNKYLHLNMATARTDRKLRSRWVATADAMGQVYAGDGGNELLPEDTADAINILRIAEGALRWENLPSEVGY